MRLRALVGIAVAVFSALGVLYAQRPFKEYPAIEYENFALPDGWNRTAEWTRARLKYLDIRIPGFYGGDRYWSMDYPRSDRHLLEGVRRLTRIDSKPVEQVVELDGSDDVFNWPWIYAVQVGEWGLTEKQGAKLREYLDRGGFFMADDSHGDDEWGEFDKRIHFAYPERKIEELLDDDPYFHVVFDITDRPQVPGEAHLYEGCKNCRQGGRGDEGRSHWVAPPGGDGISIRIGFAG